MSQRSRRPGGREDPISETRGGKGFKNAAQSMPNVTEKSVGVVCLPRTDFGALGFRKP